MAGKSNEMQNWFRAILAALVVVGVTSIASCLKTATALSAHDVRISHNEEAVEKIDLKYEKIHTKLDQIIMGLALDAKTE